MNTTGGREESQNAAPGAGPVSPEQETGASIETDNEQLALPLSSGRHIMRAEEPDHDGKASPEHVAAAEEMNLTMREHSEPTFGQRLRVAREKKGLSRAEIAQRLKLPLRLVERIESDDYAGMDEGVYLRGYLSSYARIVEIPAIAAENVAAQHTRAAPLVATGKVSRSRYLFDRYSVSATYLILTALIVVPAVWLATHGGLEQNLARTTPLDSPGTSIAVPPAETAATQAETSGAGVSSPNDIASSASSDATATVAATEPPKPQEQMPVVASMAPFGTSNATPPAAPAEAQPAKPAATGAHSLTLKLNAASWVEILADDGSKLEYGLLPAGAEKTYSSDGPLSVRLGNADGAEVVVDGKAIDLAPFRHSNVARLSLFGADSPKAEF
jgi:cytoskeleton protein RodZ